MLSLLDWNFCKETLACFVYLKADLKESYDTGHVESGCVWRNWSYAATIAYRSVS